MFLHHTISGLLVPHGVLLPDHQYTVLLLSVSLYYRKKIYVETLSFPEATGGGGKVNFLC